ncbi:MAG: ATP-binding protein, partial [Oscillospiraceae bacterium]|nr:ATP-binding protein [Oscillospiraceae bacterium]
TLNGIMQAQAEKIHEAHQRTMLMMDAVPICSMLWDAERGIFDCNEESVRKFGTSSKQEFTERFFDFSPKHQPSGLLSRELAEIYLKKTYDEGRCVFEWMHSLPDGTLMPCEMTLVRIDHVDGSFVAAYAQDLSKHKKMMAETLRLHGELKAALKEAQEANRAKSSFLASMSHEMRTPLNAVVGLSELILGAGAVSGEAEEKLDKIHISGMTLLGIVNDILDISKIESGKFELHPIEYDTAGLINDIASLNVIRISEKPITFKLTVDERLPERMIGDDLRVKQIFNNLLSNAFKYTNEGTVEWVVTFEKNGSDIWLLSEVRDTGIGIKQGDMHKVFMDYSQVDAETNRKTEGTGLGLPITKRLVNMMDGDIGVQSEYGVGSLFYVRIRQAIVSETPIGSATADSLMNARYTTVRRSYGAGFARIDLSYARVLVVDDVQTNLDVIKGMLKPYGMRVDCATSGSMAIDMALQEGGRYDAIFMDHMMPGMDGIEAAHIIMDEFKAGRTRVAPIIALTANAIVGNEEMFMDNGFSAFISKPIDVMRLDSILRSFVRDMGRESGANQAGHAGQVGQAGQAGQVGQASQVGQAGQAGEADVVSIAGEAGAVGISGEVGATNADALPSAVPGSDGRQAQGMDYEYGADIAIAPDCTGAEYTDGAALILSIAAGDIDAAVGLGRFCGDADTYVEVLRSFQENTPGIMDKMGGYLAGGHLREYAIAVHGVKSSCYGIGALRAGDEAGALESLANAGDVEGTRRGGLAFSMYMGSLMRAIGVMLDEYAAYMRKPQADEPDWALVESLREACLDYDIEGVEAIMEKLESLEYANGGTVVAWLREQVDDLNFMGIADNLYVDELAQTL